MIFATKTVNSPFGIDVASGEPISSSLDSSASLPVYFVRTDYRITGRGRDGGVPLFEIVYSTVTPMGTNSGGATLESQANHWPNQTIFSSRTSLQCVAGGDPHAPQSTLRFLESSTQNNVGGAQWNVLSSRDMHSLTERSSSALEEVAEWSTVRSVAVTQRTTEYSATDEEDSSVLVNDTSVTITTVSDASIVLNATVLAAFSLAEVMEEETSSAVSSLPYVYASVPIAYVTNATRTSEKRSSSPHQSYPLYCVDYNVLTGSSMTVQVLYDLSNTNGVVSEYEQLLAPIARAKRALQTSPSWAFVQEGLVTWRVEESQPDPPSAEEPSPVYGVYEVGDGMTERRYAVHFSDRAACRLQWMHNSTWGTRWNTSSSPVISATFSHPEYPYIYRTCAEHSPELMDLLDNAASGSCSDSTEVVNNIFKQDYLLQKRLTQPTVPTAHVVNAYYRGSIPLLSASDNESRDIADSARLVPDLTAKAPSGETAATRRRTSMFQGDPEDSAITNPIAVVRPGELNTVLDRGVHRLSPSRFEAIVESCSRPAGSPSEDPLSRLLPQDKELCQALVSEVVAVQQEQAMDPLASYSMEELLQHPLVDFQATYDMNRWWCEGEATDDASMMRCILREWFLQEMDLRKRSKYYHSLHPIQDPRVRGEYYVVPTEPIATVRSRRSSSEYAGYALDHAAEDPTTFSMERVVRYRDVPTMGRLSSTRRWQHSDRPPLSLPQIEEPPLVLALPEQQLPAAVSQPFRRREGWAMHAEKSREAVFNFVVVPVSLLLSAAMLLAGSILRGIYLYQVWKQGAEGRDERTGLLLSMYVGLMEQLTSMLCRLADSMLATAQRQMLYRALLLESDSAETAVANESSSGPAHEYPKTVTIDGTAVVMISPELVMYPDHVVGRGSHGTLVCKGLWHNKIPVAVKQMLALYQSYASREITTLVELSGGDGHPNIVKYFYASQALVHQQADGSGAAVHQSSAFVYLALQLCQMSLKYVVDRW